MKAGMTRKNTLVDYLNAGANLAQVAQLSGVRRSIENQNQLAAMELAFEETRGKLLESIFQADTLLRNLKGASARNENTVGVLALAQESLLNIKRNPISQHMRSYTDKERLRAVTE